MKKIALVLALVMLAMLLASCGVLGGAKDEGGNTIMESQDSKIMEDAQRAYADYITENGTAEFMMYEKDGRFIAFHNGTAVGVYDSQETAMTELFDNQETTTDESKSYISISLPDSAWYLCRKNFRGMTYIAFGDSITYGIDGNFKHDELGYKMLKPYPVLVSETLKLSACNNQGVSGATLTQCGTLTNMTQKIKNSYEPANIISVMLGVNDFSNQCPLGEPTDKDNSTIYGSLHLISEHLTNMYPDAFIFYMTPFQCHRSYNGVYYLEDVADAIKTVAAQYDIPILDMYAYGKYEIEMNVSPNDGLHPSQQHHITYTAPLISSFIAQHYHQ